MTDPTPLLRAEGIDKAFGGVPGLAYNIFIGAIILGMMALHSWLERRHQAGT